jgi:transposase
MNKSPIKSVVGRRKFDQTFKQEAVKNWVASGKTADAVAQELGLAPHHLYSWKADLAPARDLSDASLQIQLEATRRELARVTEQRDILKKTLGILSEPLPNAMPGSTR